MHRSLAPRLSAIVAAVALSAAVLTGCAAGTTAAAPAKNPGYTTEATDTFPVTVAHRFGETTVAAEPQRVVVAGLTEQDILLELGVTPIATTEWYGSQPHAVWPWATPLLNGTEPVVLDRTAGLQFEKITSLQPDLIVATNAALSEEDYRKLSAIAPTIADVEGSERYFSDWRTQTRQVAAAVGRSAAGDDLISGVDQAYAAAKAAHPAFASLQATFSQATPYEGNLYVYPDGLNTDFLTELGFTMTPGLEKYAAKEGTQALISAENVGLLEADVVVFATESSDQAAVDDLLGFGTLSQLPAVTEHRAVFTDATLAGAIYFLTPLSQKYVLEHLLPLLETAVGGTSPRAPQG